MYIRTYVSMYVCIRTWSSEHGLAYIHTYMHTYMHTYRLLQRSHTYIYIYTYIHTCTQIFIKFHFRRLINKFFFKLVPVIFKIFSNRNSGFLVKFLDISNCANTCWPSLVPGTSFDIHTHAQDHGCINSGMLETTFK